MVSWDLEVKFLGVSPNVKELIKLAKEEGFSNIEEIEHLKTNSEGNGVFRLVVNNRGLKQKEFKAEVIKR